jgi:hypothetical protein
MHRSLSEACQKPPPKPLQANEIHWRFSFAELGRASPDFLVLNDGAMKATVLPSSEKKPMHSAYISYLISLTSCIPHSPPPAWGFRRGNEGHLNVG